MNSAAPRLYSRRPAFGKNDKSGLKIIENDMHIHDLQATILHCPGMGQPKLTYYHLGGDFRLTGVGGRVVGPLLGQVESQARWRFWQ